MDEIKTKIIEDETKADASKNEENVNFEASESVSGSSDKAPSSKPSADKKPAGKGSKRNLILTVIGIALCVILIPVLIINVTLIIKSYTDKDAVPSIGGIFPMIVLTDSMYPYISSGDLIVCKQADPETLKVDDVITFFDPSGNGKSTVTHRIIEITEKNGETAFKTKGDNNNTEDREDVVASKVIGIYSFRIPGLGNVAMFMQTTPGLIVCVVLPLVLLVGYEILRSRKFEKARRKDAEALQRELDELRAKQKAGKGDSSD